MRYGAETRVIRVPILVLTIGIKYGRVIGMSILIPTIGMRYGAETRVIGVAILVLTIGIKYGRVIGHLDYYNTHLSLFISKPLEQDESKRNCPK